MKINILTMVAVALLALGACSVRVIDNKEINGEMVEKTLDIKDFDELEIADYGHVYYTVGDSFSVRVAANEGDWKTLGVEKKGGALCIGTKDQIVNRKRIWHINYLKTGTRIIHITAPYLKDVNIAGSVDFICKDTIEVKKFEVSIAGSGDVKLAGVRASSVEFDIAGSGDIKASLMDVAWSGFSIAGSGDMDLNFHDCGEASVSIAGSGDVKLKGTLGTFTQSVAGSGDIETKELQLTGKKAKETTTK